MITPLTALLIIIIFTVTFIVSEKIKNAGFIDVVWGFTFGIIAAFKLLFFALTLKEPSILNIILAVLICTNSLRLGCYLWQRFAKHIHQEDSRYAFLRAEWGQAATRNMGIVFVIQAVLVFVLTLPFDYLLIPTIHVYYTPLFYAGIIIYTLSIYFESLADKDLANFRALTTNPLEICQIGLWRYSRHPNYFFQWLQWVGLSMACYAVSLQWWVFLTQPVLMYLILTQASGVKFSEELMLKKRPVTYKEYQETTSAFFPLPKRTKNKKV